MPTKHIVPNFKIERLKSLLGYTPQTGEFIWLDKSSPLSNRVRIGQPAGSYNISSGYKTIMIDKQSFLTGRLAWWYMEGIWPYSFCIDHINGDTTDDRFVNLRLVTHAENMQNKKKYKNNTAGHTGVYFEKGIITARITVAERDYYLGSFPSVSLAAAAYQTASETHFGEFARQPEFK